MSKNIILKAENISKQYRLGQVGTGTISHDLNRWWHQIRGKENPYLKIGDTNDRSIVGSSDYVWALKDINFEVERGEVLGIIGKNGAGKSTLLKILSRVTAPTTGGVKTKGRIASLLEVGTGFHPELTGRENIYLNGAILGMSKNEITRKLDEIIDFSGVERYIDTPVKRYSSGMYVRLAFAVAAHLESEVLIVDEVLSVGDAEFQKKCLSKMGDISKGEGRTVLFVSHNMPSVKSLCNKGILLEHGKIIKDDKIDEVITKYMTNDEISSFEYENNECGLKSFEILNSKGVQSINISNGEDLTMILTLEIKKANPDFGFCIAIYNEYEELITAINSYHINEKIINLKRGQYSLNVVVPKYVFNTGLYTVNFHFNSISGVIYKKMERITAFNIYDDGYRRGNKYSGLWPGKVSIIPNIYINETA
ncbi:ABC transporter ATP-binding protein [Flavobacterium luteum]|uniref:ATP-binding cassette domain-containing protein n=1 Tax=Flavobacterium luteum TaxID=2026654 RepID=A0A7J5AE40_9FLAO|nr:ABC transporter ATP-binding protein [Flavobacterium luteum]KAB1155851.1 ATP-binding cassette domain-containing protein [Flavobacterium luteum]